MSTVEKGCQESLLLQKRSPTPVLGRLTELLRRAESGEPVEPREVYPLTQTPDRATRGLAKRLLAVVLSEQTRRDAARLLCEACEDLEYRHPALLNEALGHLYALRQGAQLFAQRAGAAEHAARRGEHIPALIHVQNAAVLDFQFDSRCDTDPDCLRRLIQAYERVARDALGQMGIAPAARRQRRSPADGKLRLAHVVCQLVDGGHAPSRVVKALLKFADREKFDYTLVVSEALAPHARHSGQVALSPPSDARAPKLIRHIEHELGIPVLRPRTLDSFLTSAADLHRQMSERQVDVAFFHGSIATPTDWLLCAWQAAPWQFDRGFGIPLYCPAVDYQFFELAPTMEKLAVLCRERGVPYGLSPNGTVDLSGIEAAQPVARATLGVPADHVILGTVGNHLSERMGPQFCQTVAGVLRSHPRTTYLIVGPGTFETQRAVFGADLVGGNGPGARVRFVGSTDHAYRWTKTFDIYVNEYPGGGGISVCEAMAAGKPVLCMQGDTSMFASVAATYVGQANLVQPATDAAYAQRLTALIEHEHDRQALGQALRQRYQQEFDPRNFAVGMTDRIWDIVQADLARS